VRRLASLALLLPLVVFCVCPLVYLFHGGVHDAAQTRIYGTRIGLDSDAAVYSAPFYATVINSSGWPG
jgi:hypothetical protein